MVKKKILRDTVEEIFDIAIDDPAAAMMKYTVKVWDKIIHWSKREGITDDSLAYLKKLRNERNQVDVRNIQRDMAEAADPLEELLHEKTMKRKLGKAATSRDKPKIKPGQEVLHKFLQKRKNPKKPTMQKGGAYKGKKHSYAAGGKVNKLKF